MHEKKRFLWTEKLKCALENSMHCINHKQTLKKRENMLCQDV